jgi:opacity protein-like surface antigen
MRESLILAVALGLTLAASPGWADGRRSEPTEELSEDARIYFGLLGAGVWQYRVEDEFGSSVVTTDAQSSIAFGGAALYGVQFNDHWAIEVEFEWIPGFDVEQSSIFGTFSDKIETSNLSSNIAYRPFNGRFAPFVSVGPGWMRAKLDGFGATGDGLAFRVGAGVDIWVTENIGLRLEGRYTLPVSSAIKDLDLVGPRAGLFYRF